MELVHPRWLPSHVWHFIWDDWNGWDGWASLSTSLQSPILYVLSLSLSPTTVAFLPSRVNGLFNMQMASQGMKAKATRPLKA